MKSLKKGFAAVPSLLCSLINYSDNDGLTYSLDPGNIDTYYDNMSAGWEVIHNLEHKVPINGGKDRTNDNDLDTDGISDWNEYDLERYGAHPKRKDIFVEVDWMAQNIYYHDEIPEYGTYDEGEITIEYKMSSRAQFLVIKPFAGHNIGLHIDDGCMGGGEDVGYDSDIFWSEFTDDYSYGKGGSNGKIGFTTSQNAIDKGMSDREGLFFYILMAYDSTDGHYYDGQEGESRIWRTLILNNRISGKQTDDYWMWLYMHETGHLWLGNGIDSTHQSSGGGYEHCSNYNCAMYADDHNYRGSYSNWDYCDVCWAEIIRGDFADSLP